MNYTQKIETCYSCEFLKKGLPDKCSACGCIIKLKALAPMQKCPKGKWGEITIQQIKSNEI